MGVWSRRFAIEHQAPVRLVGVHFKPWGLSPFVDVPLTELRDRWVPADVVWGRSFYRLHDRLAGAVTTGEMLQMVETELRCRLQVTPPFGLQLVDHTAGRIEASWGAVSVGALSEDAGVTGNRLAAQFTTHVGLTPKRMARIYRFARVILSVDARHPVDWSQLAQTAATSTKPTSARSSKTSPATPRPPTWSFGAGFPAQKHFPPDNGPMPVP